MRYVLAAVLSVGLALSPTGCRQSDPEPQGTERDTLLSGEGSIDAGGVQLFYRTVGTGDDTVVVIHGGPGFTSDYIAADLEPLASQHTLVFYDQRGTGQSTLVTDSSELAAERFAEDLEAVRMHFGLDRLTILGHSWGAGVAALYAMRYPDRVERLLIVGGIPLQERQLTEAFERLNAGRDGTERSQMQAWREARQANPADAEACRAYYVLWFRPFFGDSAAARRSKGDFCAGTAASRRNKMSSVDRFTMASLGDWDWRSAMASVNASTLVIHGTVDPLPLEGAREWASTLPNARLLTLDGVGHFPYLETPEAFFAASSEFINGAWPEGAQVVRTR